MRVFKEMIILFVGFIAVIYLINPGFGILEFLPDNLPLIGNLDETGAAILLMNVLAYYGIDVANLFQKSPKRRIVKRVVKRPANALNARNTPVIDDEEEE